MTWQELETKYGVPETGVVPPPPASQPPPRIPQALDAPTLLVVDRFDPAMIDMNESGARVWIRQISRAEALDLVRSHGARAITFREKDQFELERELQLEPIDRPKLTQRTQLLVMQRGVTWNDRRWYLMKYESDGEGVVEE